MFKDIKIFMVITFLPSLLFASNMSLNFGFIKEDRGLDRAVSYYSHLDGGMFYVTENEQFIYTFASTKNDSVHGISFTEMLLDADSWNISAQKEMEQKLYFAKNSQNGLNTHASYQELALGYVYKGIRMELSARAHNVEKIFLLDPHACPEQIKIGLKGSVDVQIDAAGRLKISNSSGSLFFSKPIAYQIINGKKHFVDVAYRIESQYYAFALGAYDPDLPLVIDPLISSCYIGGSADDDTYEPSVAVDSKGNVFVTGYTLSVDFPTTPGAYCNNFKGFTDRFLAKLSPEMDTLLACTFLGGTANENGMGICIDQWDQVFVSGYTYSDDFPTTSGAYDRELGGTGDIYISKFSNDLSQLIASTYVGGSSTEGPMWPRIDMTIDADNNIYVVGLSLSDDFPLLPDSYDETCDGGQDGGDIVIFKMDADLTALLGSTYLGGSSDEWRPSIILDAENNIFVCGETESSEFETTGGAYDRTFNGGVSDVFISRFSNDLSELHASTFIGGYFAEEALCIRAYESSIYIAGYTQSVNFPSTKGVYDEIYNGGANDAFIARLDKNLAQLEAATFVGTAKDESARDLHIDQEGVYITGNTSSYRFPATEDAFDDFYNGGKNDAFACKFNPELSSLLHATFIGGSKDDKAYAMCACPDNNFLICGLTSSLNFPTTEESFSPEYNGGGNDLFALIIDKNFSNIFTGKDEIRQQDFKELVLMPNPVVDQLRIQGDFVGAGLVLINIKSMNGEGVMSIRQNLSEENHVLTVDVSSLAPGYYIVECQMGHTDPLITKMLKF